MYARKELSRGTRKRLRALCDARVTHSVLGEERAWDAARTADEIDLGNYFPRHAGRAPGAREAQAHGHWPEALQWAAARPLLLAAVGGLLAHLRYCMIDASVVSRGQFGRYDALRGAGSLVMDGQALVNLEVLRNSIDGGEQGTLVALVGRFRTAFGGRLMRRWLCHPAQRRAGNSPAAGGRAGAAR